jgi:hypothetical protein
MKQPFGAKLARSYMHSMPWIDANRKNEGVASSVDDWRKLPTSEDDDC